MLMNVLQSVLRKSLLCCTAFLLALTLLSTGGDLMWRRQISLKNPLPRYHEEEEKIRSIRNSPIMVIFESGKI